MATVVKPVVEYPDPVAAWGSGRRLRFVLVLLLLTAFYSASCALT